VCGEYGYRVDFPPIGDDDPEVGPPTQMALFGLAGASGGSGSTEGSTGTGGGVSVGGAAGHPSVRGPVSVNTDGQAGAGDAGGGDD